LSQTRKREKPSNCHIIMSDKRACLSFYNNPYIIKVESSGCEKDVEM